MSKPTQTVYTDLGIHITTQWVLGAHSPGVKWPGHETNHSPPSTAEVKDI